MRPIAIETNDFETLRNAGQIYVDETAHLHRLITDARRKTGDAQPAPLHAAGRQVRGCE